MKRVCLFAGYDSKGIIHDYVVYYLKELSTVSEVYYMADNEISDIEKEKIKPYVKGAYGFNHKKYDFGSWQELIKIIGWEKIYEYDELILANDSVFGPLYPMKEFFEIIEKDKEWDVFGIDRVFSTYIKKWYCSSFFLIFKKSVFKSNILQELFQKIPDEVTFEYAIKELENPLMEKFYSNNYKVKVFCGLRKNIYYFWQEFCDAGVPFIKKKIFSEELFQYCNREDWHIYLKNNTQYNAEYIDSYIQASDGYVKDIEKFLQAQTVLEKENKIQKFLNWLIRINIKKDKLYFKLFGFYFIKINKNKYIYEVLGRNLKYKMNSIPIKEIRKDFM